MVIALFHRTGQGKDKLSCRNQLHLWRKHIQNCMLSSFSTRILHLLRLLYLILFRIWNLSMCVLVYVRIDTHTHLQIHTQTMRTHAGACWTSGTLFPGITSFIAAPLCASGMVCRAMMWMGSVPTYSCFSRSEGTVLGTGDAGTPEVAKGPCQTITSTFQRRAAAAGRYSLPLPSVEGIRRGRMGISDNPSWWLSLACFG